MSARFRFGTVLAVVCCAVAAVSAFAAAPPAAEKLGEPLSSHETTSIGELLAHPERYLDQTVRVRGQITGVCPMAGCWMTLMEEGQGELRIKVDDGVIVFPTEATGRTAIAEGTFTRHELDLEASRRHLAHLAEELGQPFDPATVKEPLVIYEIKGRGAEIEPSAAPPAADAP